jgi:hypothetical protein
LACSGLQDAAEAETLGDETLQRIAGGALRAVAKRFEQIADKIDIDEPREMTSISPDAPGAAP